MDVTEEPLRLKNVNAVELETNSSVPKLSEMIALQLDTKPSEEISQKFSLQEKIILSLTL